MAGSIGGTIEGGVLYIVATPIGNLSDITLRAIETLKAVDVIAAEDTRTTTALLEKYSIQTRLISYHKYSENKRTELFLNYLKEGKSVALVTDAGTPLISDPGNILVEAVLKEGFRVVPVVGASAVIALLSAVNREDEDFKFIGFIPREKGKIEKMVLENKSENLVFYESPQRILDTLDIINNIAPDKVISVGRELTKKFEEIKKGTISEIIEYFKKNTIKGEFVCLLHKCASKEEIELDIKIKKLKELDYKDKQIAEILSALYGVNKNTIKEKLLSIKN